MNAMRFLVQCAILLAVLRLPMEAQASTVAMPDSSDIETKNICTFQQSGNETRLVPTVYKAEDGLCVNVSGLCPKKVSKIFRELVEEETVLVENCCPGYVRNGDDEDCVEIEEKPVNDLSNNYVHLATTDIHPPKVMLAKIVKAFAEEYGYKESELNLEDFVYNPFPSIYETRDQVQNLNIPQDFYQEGDQSENGYPEEQTNAGLSKRAKQCVDIFILRVSGVVLSLIMVLFNMFLATMVYMACCTRTVEDEDDIITELEKIAKTSSKFVKWEEVKSVEKSAGSFVTSAAKTLFQSMARNGRRFARDESTGAPRKIMSVNEIKNVIIEVLASFANYNGKDATKLAINDSPQLEGGQVPNEHCISADTDTFILPGKASKSTNTEAPDTPIFTGLQAFEIPDSVALDVNMNGPSDFCVVFEGLPCSSEEGVDGQYDDSDSDYVEDSDVEDNSDTEDVDEVVLINECDKENNMKVICFDLFQE